MHTAESNFSNFVMEYLGKIETELENTLACLSGAQVGSNHEKMEVENLVTHSLYECASLKRNIFFVIKVLYSMYSL